MSSTGASTTSRNSTPRRGRGAALWVVGLAIAVVLAGFVSFYASSSPDGLERVSDTSGFAGTAQDSAASSSPLADYEASGVENARLSTGAAGVAGVAVVALLGTGVMWTVRRRGSSADSS